MAVLSLCTLLLPTFKASHPTPLLERPQVTTGCCLVLGAGTWEAHRAVIQLLCYVVLLHSEDSLLLFNGQTNSPLTAWLGHHPLDVQNSVTWVRHHSRSVTRVRALSKSDNILKSSNQTASNSYWWLLPRSRKEGLDKGHELFGPNKRHLFNYELRIQHPVGCSRVCDWVLFGWVERMWLFRKWVKF